MMNDEPMANPCPLPPFLLRISHAAGRVRQLLLPNEFDARLRAFPAQPVFGPAFTPGCSQCHDAFCQPRLRGSWPLCANKQEPRKRG
jgi:hypothetical protein